MFLSTNPDDWIMLDEVGSTNSYLMDQNFKSGVSCLAKKQTSGRGRLGKTWLSHPQDSFIYSGLLEFSIENEFPYFTFISILCALSIIEALQQYVLQFKTRSDHILKIKWPNDVLMKHEHDFGKLAGILLESKIMGSKIKLIIGVGLNWCGELPEIIQAGFKPVSFFKKKTSTSVDLLPFLISAINHNLRLLLQSDIKTLIKKIHRVFFGLGSLVRVNGQLYQVSGINEHGALVLKDDNHLEKIIYHLNESINWKYEYD